MHTKTLLAAALTAAVTSAYAGSHSGTGGIISYDGNYVIHTFTNATEAQTFTFDGTRPVDILLVGGGGGGGSCHGGGGGGGGVVVKSGVTLGAGSYTINIGAGGTAGNQNSAGVAGNGGDTTFANGTETLYTAHGGGGGGCYQSDGAAGACGGGGGGKHGGTSAHSNGGAAELYEGVAEGYKGGEGGRTYPSGWWYAAGGGGGAGGAGENSWYSNDLSRVAAGDGGVGITNAITGVALGYGGGGGGGSSSRPTSQSVEGWKAGYGSGFGHDGGGNGGCHLWNDATKADMRDGADGMDGRGGGGGGGGAAVDCKFDPKPNWSKGGKGGCGTVIIRYEGDFEEEFTSASATGAEVKYFADGSRVYIFKQTGGTLTLAGDAMAEMLLVGGGGGGGGMHGGGGGGGGVLHRSVGLFGGTYAITIGAGGAGGNGTSANASDGANGEDTVLTRQGSSSRFVAQGGGGGATAALVTNAGRKGLSGATGGGGVANVSSSYDTYYTGDGGEGLTGQGYAGGIGLSGKTNTTKFVSIYWQWGGGGGGAGGPGCNAWYTDDNNCCAGNGGAGYACSITGTEVRYGGGGGGGANARPTSASYGAGYGSGFGVDGGGNGGSNRNAARTTWDGANGTDYLGGGGGGGGDSTISFSSRVEGDYGNGGNGGCGIVIVRVKVAGIAEHFGTVTATSARVRRLDSTTDYDQVAYTFNQNGTLTVEGDSFADVLLVGGGGGGGSHHGGGGGAGGVITQRVFLAAGTYNVTVGAGGAGGAGSNGSTVDNTAYNYGQNGASSILATDDAPMTYLPLVAYGGGGGASVRNDSGAISNGLDGASGGGGCVRYSGVMVTNTIVGKGIAGQGHDGGRAKAGGYAYSSYWQWGGGGGGAGAVGGDARSEYGSQTNCCTGVGGDGIPCDYSGTEKWYGGGGSGGTAGRPEISGCVPYAAGGRGGGGRSGYALWATDEAGHKIHVYAGADGEDGTGGGGGGGGFKGDAPIDSMAPNQNYVEAGGKGGDGVVVIRLNQTNRVKKGLILIYQ